MNTSTKPTLTQGTALRHATLGAAVCMAGLLSPLAQAADGGDWEWMVAPYGWFPTISTDLQTSLPPPGGIGTDTDLDDVVDKLDGAFLIHAEGQNEYWGVFTDFTYLGLGDSGQRPRFTTESDLDARLFELAGVWSPGEGRYRGLDVFAGLRYIDVDITVQVDPENPLFATTTIDGGDSFSDFMIGARYTWALTDRWGLTLRGDGSFGDTEGTWNTSAVGSYRTKRGAWLFGYRYLSIELETGDADTELSLHGPMVGYGFIF